MATCSVVNVLCPNGRRQKVKLSPQMTLRQLIQEVCKKQGLNPNSCSIRHQRKVLDSTLTVRFANLPNNAHLELLESGEEIVPAAKKCVVALQLESGDRLMHEFNSDDSLFKILEHWKSQSERIKFGDSGDDVVCIYANQEIRGLEKLKSTTLSMIGLNGGRGVIRLLQPSPARLEKEESVMMEGVNDKAISQSNSKAAPTVATKLSSEEMDVSSRSASSVSMTSQGSEDDTMQCTESLPEPPHSEKRSLANQSESSMHCTESLPESTSHSEKPGLTSQSENGSCNKSRKWNKSGKDHEVTSVMDVEQGKSQAVKDLSAPTVQVFGGIGRTLSQTGPEIKKPRFDSPPPIPSKTPDALRKDAQSKNYENVSQCDREAVVFKLGDGGSIFAEPVATGYETLSPMKPNGVLVTDDISDDFFEVTVDDLRLMLKDLKNERTGETPLMTKSMRDDRERSKMDQYEKVTLRVYFPDRYVLQGFFSPKEKVSAVTNFVRENLQDKNANFYLYTTPPRTLLDKPNTTLFDAKLFPTAVIHFGSREAQGCYLSAEIVQRMISGNEANEKVSKYYRPSSVPSRVMTAEEQRTTSVGKDNDKPAVTGATPSTEPQSAVDSVARDSVRQNANKPAPKWFKLGK